MTSQWSALESWRRDVKEEDRRILGAAVRSLKEPVRVYKDLKKLATNTKASSIGNGNVIYEERAFMLLYFPEEYGTPPCYMYFPHTMLVGKLCDRLSYMLEMPKDGPQAVLVRLGNHEPLQSSKELKCFKIGLHEEFILTIDGKVPEYFPAPKKEKEETQNAQENTTEKVAAATPLDQEATPCDPEGTDHHPPEGLTWWGDVKFDNKKFQPIGDKTISAGKRLQLAVFLLVENRPQRALYMYFNKDWVAGRSVDTALRAAEIPNPNLTETDPARKLVAYNLRTLASVPSSTPLADCDVKPGDPVLVAPGAGLPSWCRVESNKYTNPEPGFEKEAKKKTRECVLM
eukprot:TRINITY_DN16505_c0_g1_i1.p1 TRINITY_DN16505_c0_g1~~TRINITY_DN16505_c0_g1_i1.p1  ORF type:complete len:354 (+),score=61.20 TRINITY_DN16505_c0_g1_i1:31-1062(+)